jgi:hypothetical protein
VARESRSVKIENMMTAFCTLVSRRQKSKAKSFEVLASECVLPSKLKRHLETTHPTVVSKPRDYFSRKLKELNQQKGSFYKQASIPTNALLESYKVAQRIAQVFSELARYRDKYSY